MNQQELFTVDFLFYSKGTPAGSGLAASKHALQVVLLCNAAHYNVFLTGIF